MKPFLVFSTAPSSTHARRIARILVREKLAACVNIVPRVHSYFRWKGKIDAATESLLVIKTLRSSFKALESCLKRVHPYAVPEIIGFTIERGAASYLAWLRGSVRGGARRP